MAQRSNCAYNTPEHTSEVLTLRPTEIVHTGRWSAAEDGRLRDAVVRHGTRWTAVAGEVGTRNGEQCAKRWNDNLNPALDHSTWSADEDRNLLSIVAIHGHNWKLIAEKFLQRRAPLSIKNRYALLMRRQKRQAPRHQHHRPSTAESRNHQLTLIRTPPSEDIHLPCSFDIVAVNPKSDSSSPFPDQDRGSTVPGSFTHLGADSATLSSGVGTNSGAMQDNRTTSNQFILPATMSNIRQISGDSQPQGEDLTTHTGWDGHALCDGIDLGSLFGGADLSSYPEEAASKLFNTGGTRSGSSDDDPKGVEFSVTCSRSKLKAMVCHVFEGAMSETAGLSDEEPVTVTLRLRR
ncbi:hypothetical protein NKR23_g5642 [Pleurostoma richardsiae]|uniref:Uncharacterized protein n=1 Tax=Pleurostoma richardsiae TaxID=41990 RepID=A0AA38RFF7_9PEZI|nr:hypothetical protein NKR23_g5642 [Pleurostoma richardsiae]